MSSVLWVMVLAIITAVICTLSRIWLVLRKQPVLTSAVSRVVLPGIVITAVATGTIQSPWPIVKAVVMDTVAVLGAGLLGSTGLVSGDGPQGLVLPALFGIGALLFSTRFSGVQIVESAVLIGDLNLATSLPLKIGNTPLGPQYLQVIVGVLVLNVAYLTVLHAHLKLIVFDPGLVQTMDIPIERLDHLAMLMVSMTTTAAFNAVGAVLVVALTIVSTVITQLLPHGVYGVYLITVDVTIACSVARFQAAYAFDASTPSGLAFFYRTVYLAVVAATVITRKLHTPHTG